MNHIQTQEDKKDARLLRQLLEKEVSNEQARMIWKHVFSDVAIWSLPEIRQNLAEVFGFSPTEIDKLETKYQNLIPINVEPPKMLTPLPSFSLNEPRVTQMINNYWDAVDHLKKAKASLSKVQLEEKDFENKEAFESIIADFANVDSMFSALHSFVGKHLDNFHQYVQGAG